jgi:hypothetical protein
MYLRIDTLSMLPVELFGTRDSMLIWNDFKYGYKIKINSDL